MKHFQQKRLTVFSPTGENYPKFRQSIQKDFYIFRLSEETLLACLMKLVTLQTVAVGQRAAWCQIRKVAHSNGEGEGHKPLGIGANGSRCIG